MASEPESRLCLKCKTPIPVARLKAVPGAKFCTPCQEKVGVVLIRRYDDHVERHGDIEVHESYTKNPNPYQLERAAKILKFPNPQPIVVEPSNDFDSLQIIEIEEEAA